MTALRVHGIGKWQERDVALQDISFDLHQGQKLALAGETGAGKSSLLKIIAGLLQPDAGSITFQGERVKGPEEQLVAGHKRIAYLSQHFELPPFLRVEQVLHYANTRNEAAARELYELCGITPLLQRKTDQTSGGERQRIALARLLVGAPELLLLDEPFSNLDMAHKADVKEVLEAVSERLRISCILVTHDPLDSLSWADHMLVLQAGRLVQQGSPQQLYEHPLNAYVAGLFGRYTLVRPREAAVLAPLVGALPAGKQLMLRPESLQLETAGGNALQATVERVHYYGSHYELQVTLSSISLQVQTTQAHYKKGDTVWLGVSQRPLHYL